MWTTKLATVRSHVANSVKLRSPNAEVIEQPLQTVSKAVLSYTSRKWYSTNGTTLQRDFGTEQEKEIFDKLNKALSPSGLHVRDISGGCGTMYKINIVSKQFNDLTMIKQHKLVNQILKDDIPQWHGLQLITKEEG